MKRLIILLILLIVFNQNSNSQYLRLTKLANGESKLNIYRRYLSSKTKDGYIELILHKNGTYEYSINSTLYIGQSFGTWHLKKNNYTLNSYFLDSIVPIRIEYLDSIKVNANSSRSPFVIPHNIKGDKLVDSRILVNDDTTFCFPYFDTCIGVLDTIRRVKVDFGFGFKSKWISSDLNRSKKIQIIAETEFVFSSFIRFKERTYRVVGKKLKLVK